MEMGIEWLKNILILFLNKCEKLMWNIKVNFHCEVYYETFELNILDSLYRIN